MEPHDQLNDRLNAAGNAISVDDDFAALTSVHDTVAGRRRRRRVITGVALSAVLVAGGVVVAGVVGNDEPDSLSIAGVEQPEPTTTTASAAADADTELEPVESQPVETTAPSAVPTPPTTGAVTFDRIDTAATSVLVPADLRDAQLNWVVPWQEGFLASRTLIVPQALPPELPEDIAALFPQEVIDFFAGELPPTISEATQMLSEAGLLDEVTAVLSEHPEASEAIYSQPVVMPSIDVSFSTDGVDWQPIDFEMPDDVSFLQSVQSTGDRLVALTEGFGPVAPDRSSSEFTPALVTTTDLVTWQRIALPIVDVPAGVPDFVRVSQYPQSLSINQTGWVAMLYRQFDVDVPSVLPLLSAEDRARLGDDTDFISPGFDSEGLTLYRFDETSPESEPEAVTVPWIDLGIDPALVEAAYTGSQVTIAADWNGEPAVVEGVVDGQVVGSSDGFYTSSASVRYSADGIGWTDLASPDGVLFIEWLLSVDSGVIAFGWDDDGVRLVYRIEGATNTWTPVGAPELPAAIYGGYFGETGASSALVVNVADDNLGGAQTITVVHDGFELTVEYGYPLTTVRLVDVAGTVLVDQRTVSLYDPESGDGPLRIDADGWTFVDVATGADIVTIPSAVIDAGHQEPQQAEYVEQESDLWILATLDGERWLFEDLGSEGVGYFGGSPVAINGTTLVVSTGPEWQVFDLS